MLFEKVHFLLCVINGVSRQSVSCTLTWNDGISFLLKIVCRLLQSELSTVHTLLPPTQTHTHTRTHKISHPKLFNWKCVRSKMEFPWIGDGIWKNALALCLKWCFSQKCLCPCLKCCSLYVCDDFKNVHFSFFSI